MILGESIKLRTRRNQAGRYRRAGAWPGIDCRSGSGGFGFSLSKKRRTEITRVTIGLAVCVIVFAIPLYSQSQPIFTMTPWNNGDVTLGPFDPTTHLAFAELFQHPLWRRQRPYAFILENTSPQEITALTILSSNGVSGKPGEVHPGVLRPPNLGADEGVAIRHAAGGPFRPEPGVVSAPETRLSPRLHAAESQTGVCSLIEERLTWPVRAVLSGGGESDLTSYRDYFLEGAADRRRRPSG